MTIFKYPQLRDQYAYTSDNTPNSELITTNKLRLVGEIFEGTTIDSSFWANRVSTGTVAQTGSEMVLTSGTAAAQYAELWSVQRAIWVTGSSNKFRAQLRFGDSGTTNVARRWGVGWVSGSASSVITDGAYFKLDGTALSVNTMRATTETSVASGSFNGTYTAPTLTNNNVYEILYTLSKVFFLINNVIVHTATFSTTHWTSGTINFNAFADVNNSGASAAVTMTMRAMNIARLGLENTVPTYKRITGATTTTLKLSGGFLHAIVVNSAGSDCTVYDQTTAAVPLIGIINTTKANGVVGGIEYHHPFYNGLVIVTTGAGTDITVIYE